jgi:hypothetical protein
MKNNNPNEDISGKVFLIVYGTAVILSALAALI